MAVSLTARVLMAHFLAALFFCQAGARPAAAAGSAPSNSVAVYLSGIHYGDDALRNTYGTVWCTGLVLDHTSASGLGVLIAAGYALRHGDPYQDPTFVQKRANELTLVPIRLGLRARGPMQRPLRFLFGVELLTGMVQERFATAAGNGRSRARQRGMLLGLGLSAGPEWSTPFHKLVAALELSREEMANAETGLDWHGDPSGFSLRLSLAAPF